MTFNKVIFSLFVFYCVGDTRHQSGTNCLGYQLIFRLISQLSRTFFLEDISPFLFIDFIFSCSLILRFSLGMLEFNVFKPALHDHVLNAF